ncbi:MAG: restriction endonuclease subunit S [Firmicutes bacterium]|nr:restriction endonuclease subunit S [Bacillota bacterium]
MSYSEWKTTKLFNLIDTVSETYRFSENQEVVLINTSDILEGKVLNHNSVLPVKVAGQFKKMFKKNDILYSEIRPANKRYAYVDFESKNYVASTKLMVLRRKNNQVDNKFLYQFLKSDDTLRTLQAVAESRSGTFPQITFTELSNLELNLPSIKEQKAIANILSSLDDKIELNNKLSKNLEEIAQTLYKKWFVDYEFPNEVGEPYQSSGGEMVESELGLTPKGWRIGNLLNIAVYMNGVVVKKYAPINDEKSLPVLKIKELGIGNCTSESDRCRLNVPEKYLIKKGDLIFSWSGTLLLDFWTGTKSVLNQHLFKVSSSDYPRWFYYFWTNLHLAKFQNIAKSMATTMGHIKRDELEKSQVIIPLNSILKNGTKFFEPIIDEIIKLRIQNNKLAKTRDELLPKLMNGEIEVPIEG